jgi:hypothetical protein
MMEEIHAIKREMIPVGDRKFACGITPPVAQSVPRVDCKGTVICRFSCERELHFMPDPKQAME